MHWDRAIVFTGFITECSHTVLNSVMIVVSYYCFSINIIEVLIAVSYWRYLIHEIEALRQGRCVYRLYNTQSSPYLIQCSHIVLCREMIAASYWCCSIKWKRGTETGPLCLRVIQYGVATLLYSETIIVRYLCCLINVIVALRQGITLGRCLWDIQQGVATLYYIVRWLQLGTGTVRLMK